jgi:hypothetical protein
VDNSDTREPILVIDNLLRTLIIAGVIFIAGLIIAHPTSRSMSVAIVALVAGFLSFILASQFLVSLEMDTSNKMTPAEKARSLRLGIPFFLGWVAYTAAGVLVCINFLLR